MKIKKLQFITVIFCYFLTDIVLISGHPHLWNVFKTKKVNKNRERERVKESQLSTCTYITSHFFNIYLVLGFLNNDCLLVFKNKKF